jgi:hypothetical protein
LPSDATQQKANDPTLQRNEPFDYQQNDLTDHCENEGMVAIFTIVMRLTPLANGDIFITVQYF